MFASRNLALPLGPAAQGAWPWRKPAR